MPISVWPPKMEHNRCIGNVARRSARPNQRLFSLHKSLAAMARMIVQAGGHSEAITYSPVGGLGPVIVLRPAGGHTVMPGWAQQHRINEPAACTSTEVCVCVSLWRHRSCRLSPLLFPHLHGWLTVVQVNHNQNAIRGLLGRLVRI